MIKIFQTSRIKVSEMLSDVSDYIKQVYNQSGTLFTAASPFGQIVMVLVKITQLMFYYIEDSITELNINTASRPHSIYGLAALTGHNPTRSMAAMGDLYLVYNGTIPNISGEYVTIPNFIKIKCRNNGLNYLGVFNDDKMRINIFTEKQKKFIKIIQGEIETQTFTGTGKNMQSYEVNMSSQKNIENYFVNVYVNSEKWQKYDSLRDIPKGTKGFIVKTGLTSGIDIFFGTEYFGTPPPLGSKILVEYLLTEGSQGNIQEVSGVTFNFEGTGYDKDGTEVDLNSIFNMGIATPISFGSDPEPIKLTRLLTPTVSRSFVLANTRNYISFFEKFQYFSYIDAYTKFDPTNPFIDNIVYLLLIPNITKRIRSGENYFTVPVDYFGLSNIEKFKIQRLLEESGQKIVTAIIKFVEPVFKKYVINISLTTFEGYSKDDIRTNIINGLSDYMIKFKRKDFLPKSDLIALIDGIDGVDSVNVSFISKEVEDLFSKYVNITEVENSTNFFTSTEQQSILNYYKLETDINNRIQFLYKQSSILNEIAKHIDENNDIKISKDEIPLIRGGWSDRYGKIYNDVINKNQLSSVNIIFGKVNKK